MTVNPELILLACATYLFAGTIKGMVGIGLPTASIGILSQFTNPRIAIALVVFPILISNAWQMYREGQVLQTVKRYWVFAVCLMVVLGAMTAVTSRIDTNVLILILGAVIVLFSATSLMTLPPQLPPRFDRAAQIIAGSLAGAIGGLTAIWSPPMVIYLLSRRVEKDEFVRVTGLLIFLGGIPLCIGFWQAGLFTGDISLLSLGLIVPTLIGFSLGEVIRRRLDAQRFRTAVLVMFLLMGLNLVRKAVFS
ncbi:MAG: sulfite exporter TauE/SafE family protein [Pseudomonadota bacterium]